AKICTPNFEKSRPEPIDINFLFCYALQKGEKMYHATLTGTPGQIGAKLGRALKKSGRNERLHPACRRAAPLPKQAANMQKHTAAKERRSCRLLAGYARGKIRFHVRLCEG